MATAINYTDPLTQALNGAQAPSLSTPGPVGNATATGPVNPTSSVGSFNTQVAPSLTPGSQAANQAQGTGSGPNQAMLDSLQRQMDMVSGSSSAQRTQQLYQIAAAKQQAAAAARAAAAAHGDSGVNIPNAGGGGQSTNGFSPGSYNVPGGLSADRAGALRTAASYLGDNYVLGGSSHAGIDCSGLVMQVYDQYGFASYLSSHLAGHQAAAIPGVRTSVKNLQPGDIVAWSDGSHIAIYAGNGMIISAAAPGEGVKYQPVWGNCYGIHLTFPGE